MTMRITERVDSLLEAILALRRDLAAAGHHVAAASPNLVATLLADPAALAGGAGGNPYEAIAPGLFFGFRKGAKPDLALRPSGPAGLEIALQRRTSSPWLTIELDWKAAAFREKGKTTLLVRGSSAEPLSLACLLRCTGEGGGTTDVTGRAVALGPDSALHLVEFAYPENEAVQACRILLFCPTEAFSMTLTELSVM